MPDIKHFCLVFTAICTLSLAGCADLEALLNDTQQDIAVVQDQIDQAKQNPDTAELAAKWQKAVDDARATLESAQSVYESAKEDGASAVETGGNILTSSGYPEAGLILTTLAALWRARRNRENAKQLAKTVAPGLDTSKVKPQSPAVERIVDEAQGKKLGLPF